MLPPNITGGHVPGPSDLANCPICIRSTAEDVANGIPRKATSKLTVLRSSCLALVFPRFDKKASDGFLTERPGSLQAVQALNEYETRSVGSHQDRRLRALVGNARGDLIYALLSGGAPFHGDVDVSGLLRSRASSSPSSTTTFRRLLPSQKAP
jgi:hypothetical protein